MQDWFFLQRTGLNMRPKWPKIEHKMTSPSRNNIVSFPFFYQSSFLLSNGVCCTYFARKIREFCLKKWSASVVLFSSHFLTLENCILLGWCKSTSQNPAKMGTWNFSQIEHHETTEIPSLRATTTDDDRREEKKTHQRCVVCIINRKKANSEPNYLCDLRKI